MRENTATLAGFRGVGKRYEMAIYGAVYTKYVENPLKMHFFREFGEKDTRQVQQVVPLFVYQDSTSQFAAIHAGYLRWLFV